MGILDIFSGKKSQKKKAFKLYNSVVQYSRNPEIFIKMEVDDSVDGRFDCIALHLSLMLRRLKQEGDLLRGFAVEVVSAFVLDMDRNLREMGVGDLSVGKHIKKMTSAFYGRAEAYESALEVIENKEMLQNALIRNIYREKDVSKEALELMCNYVYETDKMFKSLKNEDLKEGNLIV